MTRSIVVGLDGASWLLMEPWIEGGDLPNIAALREHGTWATSRSCLPPVTFPNWKCYSSGKNPGKFGVFWWERIDLDEGTLEVMNGADYDTAELWDYLNEAGLSTGVVNMPSMYPPREIDGPVIAGGPDAVDGEYRSIDSGYTSPASLERELVSEYDYRVHPDPMISSNRDRGDEVEAVLELLNLRFEVGLDLFERKQLDFLHVTLFYLNVLHHFFWDEAPVKRAWELVDDWLGRLSDLKGVNLIMMSDHGSAPTTTEFYINKWLDEQGYLSARHTVEDHLQAIGLDRETALTIAKRFDLVDLLSKFVPERIQKLIPQAAGAKRERKLEKLVLAETKAVASGQGPIYLNPRFNVEEVASSLIQELSRLSTPDGEPLFRKVSRGGEVYSGPYADSGPDLVLDQRPGVHVNDGMRRGDSMTAPDRWAAENTRTGIFVAIGPDFDATGHIGEISITDIAPTILASQDLAIPADMDGEVLPILAADDFIPETREPIDLDRTTHVESEGVTNRLKHLGYME